MPRPNIILFHAESWDGRMLGCAGHPALRHATPNIDRLAESGAYFENAYCSHPICCPSRANMWSGQYPHQCESCNNYKGLEPGMWSLLDELPKTVKNFGICEVVGCRRPCRSEVDRCLGDGNKQ